MSIITISTSVSYTEQTASDGGRYSIEEFFHHFYIQQVGYLAQQWINHAIGEAQTFEQKQDLISHGIYSLKEMADRLSSDISKTISFEPTEDNEIEVCFSFTYIQPTEEVQSYPSPQSYVCDELILSMQEMSHVMIEKAAQENKAHVYQLYIYLNKILEQVKQSILIEVI